MGSHRYVRFCIDGEKWRSEGTQNEWYIRNLGNIAVGESFPFHMFNMPNIVLEDSRSISDIKRITFIFLKSHSACRFRRTVEMVCEIILDRGLVVSKSTVHKNGVVVQKYDDMYKFTTLSQFKHIANINI